jgi:hypothetical protein
LLGKNADKRHGVGNKSIGNEYGLKVRKETTRKLLWIFRWIAGGN